MRTSTHSHPNSGPTPTCTPITRGQGLPSLVRGSSAARHGETWDLDSDGSLIRVFFLDLFFWGLIFADRPPPSPGAQQAEEPPRATRSQPESIRTVQENCRFFFVFFGSCNIFSKFSPKPPQHPILSSPDSPHWPVRTAREPRTTRGRNRPVWEIWEMTKS